MEEDVDGGGYACDDGVCCWYGVDGLYCFCVGGCGFCLAVGDEVEDLSGFDDVAKLLFFVEDGVLSLPTLDDDAAACDARAESS